MDGKVALVPSVTYVGLGNIGSYAVLMLARSGHVRRFTLVDFDRYEARNVGSQDVRTRDVGRFKVDVLAARLHQVDPTLQVDTIRKAVELVPLGRLRADVIAGGLDSLGPRRWLQRAAWRLGVPYVDSGVRAEGQLARVDTVEPTPDGGCLECGWSDQETASLDIRHPCTPAVPTPTGAPAHLGALAASVQTRECLKLLTGETAHTPLPHQILMAGITHRCYVSGRRRSADCRFDHLQWPIRTLADTPGAITLRQALRLVPTSGDELTRLRVHGDTFVHRLVCPGCHASGQVLRLASRIPETTRQCPHCRTPRVAAGIHVTDSLELDRLADVPRRVSLHALGFRVGDLFSVETSSGETHFEIGGR